MQSSVWHFSATAVRIQTQFEQKVVDLHCIAQVNSCNKACGFNTALPHDRGWEQPVLAAPQLGSTALQPPGALQGAISSSKSWWVHVLNFHVHIWSVCTRDSLQSALIYWANQPTTLNRAAKESAACTQRRIVLMNVCLQHHSSCRWPSRAVPGPVCLFEAMSSASFARRMASVWQLYMPQYCLCCTWFSAAGT